MSTLTMVPLPGHPNLAAVSATELRRSWIREVPGLSLVVLTFIAATLWSWGRWLDPIIDFGRELYIPWQIAAGKLPQIDIITSYGPLSHLFNALCFRTFGTSLLTLVCINLVILAIASALIYAIVRQISTRLSATACGMMFLALFGFAHLLSTGNFSFVTPYSHEVTHGFTIGLIGLYCLLRFARETHLAWVAGMGLCIGAAFLTKPEIFVAVAGTLLFGAGMLLWSRRKSEPSLPILTLFITTAFVPLIIVGIILLWMGLPFPLVLREISGAWAMVGKSSVRLSFYANSTGLEDPELQLKWIAMVAAILCAFLGPGLVAATLLRDGGRRRRITGASVGAAGAGVMIYLLGSSACAVVDALLMLGMIALGATQIIGFWKHRRNSVRREACIARLSLTAFAALMLLKMFLHTRFQQYGFVLGVMATMLLVVALLDWIPAALEAKGRCGWVFRGSALAMLSALTITCVLISTKCMAGKNQYVGSGSDAFLADERAPIMQDMMNFIARDTTPGQTLTVFPEGATLNFLTRRASPVPYVLFTPPELAIFGEGRVIAAIERGRPDYVAILHRLTADFGPAAFGVDYGMPIRAWMIDNYVPIHLSGTIPFSAGSNDFGILLFKRKELMPVSANAAPHSAIQP